MEALGKEEKCFKYLERSFQILMRKFLKEYLLTHKLGTCSKDQHFVGKHTEVAENIIIPILMLVLN